MPPSGSKAANATSWSTPWGCCFGVTVTPASTPERDGAKTVLGRVACLFTKLRRLWVDGGYTGDAFAQWVKDLCPELEVEVVKRSDNTVGFKVLPRRWVVERTFGWLMRHRRLARDYENTETSAEAWIYIAMIRTHSALGLIYWGVLIIQTGSNSTLLRFFVAKYHQVRLMCCRRLWLGKNANTKFQKL